MIPIFNPASSHIFLMKIMIPYTPSYPTITQLPIKSQESNHFFRSNTLRGETFDNWWTGNKKGALGNRKIWPRPLIWLLARWASILLCFMATPRDAGLPGSSIRTTRDAGLSWWLLHLQLQDGQEQDMPSNSIYSISNRNRNWRILEKYFS